MFRSLKTGQLIVDVGVGVGFLAVALVLSPGSGTSSAGALVALAMATALGVRRLSPALALGVAWAGAIVQMLAGLDPMPANLAVFAVLYVTAAYGSRSVFYLGLASALVGAVVITVYLVLVAPFLGGALTWNSIPVAFTLYAAATFALLLSWTVGALARTAIRAAENRRARQRAELEAATEHERGRIARDMHDVVAHSLAVVIAQADGARYALTTPGSRGDAHPPPHPGTSGDAQASTAAGPAVAGPAAAVEALETIGSTARSALADVRRLLTQLRHSQGSGPQPALADLERLYAEVRAAGLDVAVDVDPAPRDEPGAAVQLAVFRILQEALTNALRHGDGGRVDVALAWHGDRVDIRVRNGRRQGETRPASGHGLAGMAERAQLAGGRVDASGSDREFVVSATLPLGAGG